MVYTVSCLAKSLARATSTQCHMGQWRQSLRGRIPIWTDVEWEAE